MRKVISMGLIYLMCIFTLGCSNIEVTNTKEDLNEINSAEKTNESKEIIKISTEDSLSEVKNKIYNACVSYSDEKNFKTMEESIEYSKSILPDGVKEIESKYMEDKGATYTTYGIEDFVFYVCYIHPYQPTQEKVDNYDLNFTSAITFPRVEINANWNS